MADETDPFQPFDNIRDAVKKIIEPLGVEWVTWQIMPGENADDPRACSILLVLKETAFETDEQTATRKAFEQIEQGEMAIRADERHKAAAEAAREDLLKLSKRGGIFDEEVSPEE